MAEDCGQRSSSRNLEGKQKISMLWVEFGCAGHGKGPWDGLGAMIKQTVRRDILHNKIMTASGYIVSPAEVAEHLHQRFSNEEWREAHSQQGGVNEIIVLYSDATNIHERALVERHKFETLDGQKKTFSYMMLEPSVFAGQQLSCFCVGCFGARGRGLGTADSNLVVNSCKHYGVPQYTRFEQQCQRTDALGIAERRKVAQRAGWQVVNKLAPGMWLAAQDRAGNENILIGQAIQVPNTNGCIHKRVDDREEWIAGTLFGRGDCAIAVQWWVKTLDDVEERTYEEWQPTTQDIQAHGIETANGAYFLVNSTELRHANFQMDVVNPLPFSPVSRRTRGASAIPERASTRGRRFRLPADVENFILALCW